MIWFLQKDNIGMGNMQGRIKWEWGEGWEKEI